MAEHGRLPVVNFAAGGVATPADAALMMQLGTVLALKPPLTFSVRNVVVKVKAVVCIRLLCRID